jgi:iron(III) transport system ATP-binding protein
MEQERGRTVDRCQGLHNANENCKHLQSAACTWSSPNCACSTPAAAAAGGGRRVAGLRAGDIGVLIGPSGCGKTTLLRAVAGLEPVAGWRDPPGGGGGQRQHSLPPSSGASAWCFRTTPCFRTWTWATTWLWHPPPAHAERARAWPKCWPWWGWTAAQRAIRTSCLAASSSAWPWPAPWPPSPQLLLLDEPFSNLDVDLRERLAHEVRGILKAAGATALFVTHDQLEAFAIGDVIGVMHEGRCTSGTTPTPCTTARPRALWPTSSAMACSPRHAARSGQPGRGAHRAGRPDRCGRMPPAWRLCIGPVRCAAARRRHRARRRCAGEGRNHAQGVSRLGVPVHPAPAVGETVLAHVPSHHDHKIGEWIGIRAEVDHVVTFASTSLPPHFRGSPGQAGATQPGLAGAPGVRTGRASGHDVFDGRYSQNCLAEQVFRQSINARTNA